MIKVGDKNAAWHHDETIIEGIVERGDNFLPSSTYGYLFGARPFQLWTKIIFLW